MAGSYGHVTKKDGSLRSNRSVVEMLENGGDVYEALEEMYGMIWYLAGCLSEKDAESEERPLSMDEWISTAEVKYRHGLLISPTKRFKPPKVIR